MLFWIILLIRIYHYHVTLSTNTSTIEISFGFFTVDHLKLINDFGVQGVQNPCYNITTSPKANGSDMQNYHTHGSYYIIEELPTKSGVYMHQGYVTCLMPAVFGQFWCGVIYIHPYHRVKHQMLYMHKIRVTRLRIFT